MINKKQKPLDKKTILKMEQHAIQPGCWPTEMQELLLKACLFQNEEGIKAWEEWKSRIDINWIDEGSHRLLPLLYHNLHPIGIKDPILDKAKGVYRYQLTKTHMMLYGTNPLFEKLQKNGIEVMLLKGTALILQYYKNFGTRPQLDIDIMVLPEKTDKAERILKDSGWRSEYEFPFHLTKLLLNSCGFHAGIEKRLDLHWDILPQYTANDTFHYYWEKAVPVKYNHLSLLSLSPTHLLFHSFIHGVRWNRHAPCRWVADAMIILKENNLQIEWDSLPPLAEELKVSIILKSALQYLKDVFHAVIPEKTLQQLDKNNISKLERFAFNVNTKNKNKIYGNFLNYTTDFLQLYYPRGFFPKLVLYPKYLQIRWGKNNLLLMPFELIAESIKLNLKKLKQIVYL